jgi:hypothetical protein
VVVRGKGTCCGSSVDESDCVFMADARHCQHEASSAFLAAIAFHIRHIRQTLRTPQEQSA